jgi:hypothetical protein
MMLFNVNYLKHIGYGCVYHEGTEDYKYIWNLYETRAYSKNTLYNTAIKLMTLSSHDFEKFVVYEGELPVPFTHEAIWDELMEMYSKLKKYSAAGGSARWRIDPETLRKRKLAK